MSCYGKRVLSHIIFAMMLISLVGCEGTSISKKDKDRIADTSYELNIKHEYTQILQCEKELNTLRAINPEQNKRLSEKFSLLMKSAAQYSGLRAQVNPGTQKTVDAMYLYKVNRLCADISQVTLTSLADAGDIIK